MPLFLQLAADMQRFSRPERRINGPTISHLWCVIMIYAFVVGFCYCCCFVFFIFSVLDCRSMLKLLDVLVQLDHLKNAKASIPNDFSWYKRYVVNLCLSHVIFRLRIFNFSQVQCFSLFVILSYIHFFSEPFLCMVLLYSPHSFLLISKYVFFLSFCIFFLSFFSLIKFLFP